MMTDQPAPRKPYSLFRVQHHPKEHNSNRIRINVKEECCLKRKNLQESADASQRESFERQIPSMTGTEREGCFKRMK
jgi:hypothetical protein